MLRCMAGSMNDFDADVAEFDFIAVRYTLKREADIGFGEENILGPASSARAGPVERWSA